MSVRNTSAVNTGALKCCRDVYIVTSKCRALLTIAHKIVEQQMPTSIHQKVESIKLHACLSVVLLMEELKNMKVCQYVGPSICLSIYLPYEQNSHK